MIPVLPAGSYHLYVPNSPSIHAGHPGNKSNRSVKGDQHYHLIKLYPCAPPFKFGLWFLLFLSNHPMLRKDHLMSYPPFCITTCRAKQLVTNALHHPVYHRIFADWVHYSLVGYRECQHSQQPEGTVFAIWSLQWDTTSQRITYFCMLMLNLNFPFSNTDTATIIQLPNKKKIMSSLETSMDIFYPSHPRCIATSTTRFWSTVSLYLPTHYFFSQWFSPP